MSGRRIGPALQVVWDGKAGYNTVNVWCTLHRDAVALFDAAWVWVVVKRKGVGTWLDCGTSVSV